MSKNAVQDLVKEFQHTFRIIYEEIERFDDQQWLRGLDSFMTPVNIAMHIFDCLDFYFHNKPDEVYIWGHHFSGGWWELPAEQLPSKQLMLDYAHSLEIRILAEIDGLSDADLTKPWIFGSESATILGHYVYAMRHTVHHHGELAALAVFHGKAGGSWD
jgi:hypothetical protein